MGERFFLRQAMLIRHMQKPHLSIWGGRTIMRESRNRNRSRLIRRLTAVCLAATLLFGMAAGKAATVLGSGMEVNDERQDQSVPAENQETNAPDTSGRPAGTAGVTDGQASAQPSDNPEAAGQNGDVRTAPHPGGSDRNSTSAEGTSGAGDQNSISAEGVSDAGGEQDTSVWEHQIEEDLESPSYKALPALKNVNISSEGLLTWSALSGTSYYMITVKPAAGSWSLAAKRTECSMDLYALLLENSKDNGTYYITLEARNTSGSAISQTWSGTYQYKLTKLILSGTVAIFRPQKVFPGDKLEAGTMTGVLSKVPSAKLRYHWYKGSTEVSTKQYYVPYTSDAGSYIRLVMTADGYEGSVESNDSVYINPFTEISGTVTITNGVVHTGDTVKTKLGSTGSVATETTYKTSYLWQCSQDKSLWYDISGATSSSYVTNAAEDKKYIRVKVTQAKHTGSLISDVRYVNPKRLNVYFEMNGHGQSISVQTVPKGEPVPRPADPSESGYTFTGWYTDKACTKAYDFSTPVQAVLTLYAGWKTSAAPKQLWRFYSKTNKDHFYTMYDSEKESLINSGSSYKYEGPGWLVLTEKTSDSVTVYRFYNEKDKDHFYTISVAERDQLIEKYKAGKSNYKYEYVGWYTPKKSGVPLYRFYNAVDKDHFYTTSAAEKADLEAKYKAGKTNYKYEGIAWYCAE